MHQSSSDPNLKNILLKNIYNFMLKFTGQPVPLKGKVLLIAAISAGNVPIYTLDHLIVQNQFKRIAYFHSDYLEPSVGYLPSNIQHGALGLPAQLYMHGDVLLLQFRTFARFARKKDLAREIAALVKSHEISDIIVVASLPYEIKQDQQILARKKIVFIKNKGKSSESVMVKKCAQLGLLAPFEELKGEDEEEEVILNCAGLSKALMKELANLTVLMMFSEGEEDKQTGHLFATQLSLIIDRKQLSNVK